MHSLCLQIFSNWKSFAFPVKASATLCHHMCYRNFGFRYISSTLHHKEISLYPRLFIPWSHPPTSFFWTKTSERKINTSDQNFMMFLQKLWLLSSLVFYLNFTREASSTLRFYLRLMANFSNRHFHPKKRNFLSPNLFVKLKLMQSALSTDKSFSARFRQSRTRKVTSCSRNYRFSINNLRL